MRRREFIAGLGSAAAWPVATRAQSRNVPVIGYLDAGSESARAPFTAAFHRGLGEQGYSEGRNVEVLYRWAESRYDRLPALAAELVSRRVAVIHAQATPSALAAKSATATIPIIFSVGTDPVSLGLVASLNRPGGNVTGVAFLAQDLIAKRLELLREVVPAARSIGFLENLSSPGTEAGFRESEIAARILGLRLTTLNATTPNEIEAAFAILVGQRVAGLLVGVDTLPSNSATNSPGWRPAMRCPRSTPYVISSMPAAS
jgi:putative ABC transport system substrate-binding protein